MKKELIKRKNKSFGRIVKKFSKEKLKILFEKINENKENLKQDVQKIFTKIRNAINDR